MGQEPNGKAAENGKQTERKIPFYETKLHDIGNVFLTPTVLVFVYIILHHVNEHITSLYSHT